MNGSFSSESLEKYNRLVNSTLSNFAENRTHDFARCVRQDGTAYGTGGSCRKGSPQEKEDKDSLKKMSISEFRTQLHDAGEKAKKAKGTPQAEKAKEELRKAIELHKKGIDVYLDALLGSPIQEAGKALVKFLANKAGVGVPSDNSFKSAQRKAINDMQADQLRYKQLYESL